MKKIALMLVMMLTMSVYSFAENNNASKIESIEKYDFKINHRRLACTLDLNKDQMESMDYIIDNFENGMLFAASINNEESRNKVISNVVKTNVKHTHYVLNHKQYKKYLTLLNLTLENRGFDINKINTVNK